MSMFSCVIGAAAAALPVPLRPAPARGGAPCAVYRYRPGRSDGAMAAARLEVRVFARSAAEAAGALEGLRRAIVTDGDSGGIGTDGAALVVRETDEGGECGYVRGSGLYYMQTGFDIRGRA